MRLLGQVAALEASRQWWRGLARSEGAKGAQSRIAIAN
jgi:hypothetical protein